MLTLIENTSRYMPLATLDQNGSVISLFDFTQIVKWGTNQPDHNSHLLWVSIDGFFNGKSLYIKPCHSFSKLIESVCIYGEPTFKDVYLKVIKNTVYIQYQQIIGSYCLFELTDKQLSELNNLFN